jgi:hypothetical protein
LSSGFYKPMQRVGECHALLVFQHLLPQYENKL